MDFIGVMIQPTPRSGVPPQQLRPAFRQGSHEQGLVDQPHSSSPPFLPRSHPHSHLHSHSPSHHESVEPTPHNPLARLSRPSVLVDVPFQRRKCTISLFFVFIFPIAAIAALYFALTYATFRHSSVSSVEDVTLQLHHMSLFHVTSIINEVLVAMDSSARLIASMIDPETNLTTIEQLFCKLMDVSPNIAFLLFGRTDGVAIATKRSTDSSFTLGERGPDDEGNNTSTKMLVYRSANASGYTSLQVSSSTVYDTKTRPWYTVAINATTPTFTAPYIHASTAAIGVSLSIPIRTLDGRLYAVVASDYLFNSITSELFACGRALHTTGVLLLLNHDGSLLASSLNNTHNLSPAEITRILQMPLSLNIRDYHPVIHEDTIAGFGDCFVLQVSFRDETSHVHAQGLDWRLVMILPKSDYFGALDSQKTRQMWLIFGCLVSFVVVVAILLHLTVRVPLRRLNTNLIALKDVLLRMTSLHTVIAAPLFTEVATVYEGVLVIIRAAEEAALLRYDEQTTTRDLRKAQEESEHLMRAKDLFFAMMSHEMRTPLTACIGLAEVLLGTDLTDQQKECVDGIALSGSSLLGLINDILDFSKIESGKMVVEKTSFSIRECVEQACQVIQIKADEKSIELIVVIDANIPDRSIGDPCRIRQVLFNLLSNSVKFTQRGYVAISCSVTGDRKMVRFEVEDTGIGLASDKVSLLFKPFSQAEMSTTRKFGGTGLGLVISQRIVEVASPFYIIYHVFRTNQKLVGCPLLASYIGQNMMGGKLEVFSEGEGHGCKFYFSLPLLNPIIDGGTSVCTRKGSLSTSASTAFNRSTFSPNPSAMGVGNGGGGPLSAPTSGPSSPEFSVLVIDRMERRRQATCELFTTLHMVVHTCDSAHLLTEGKLPEPAASASLVVVHLQDYLATFRANPATRRPTVPLSTTGVSPAPPSSTSHRQSLTPKSSSLNRKFIFIVNMKQSLSGPFEDSSTYVSKPVTLHKITDAVRHLYPDPVNEEGSPSRSPSGAFSMSNTSHRLSAVTRRSSTGKSGLDSPGSVAANFVRILVVDDVILNQRVITMKLQQKGYNNVDVAGSGAEALELIRNNPTVYNVILMDVS